MQKSSLNQTLHTELGKLPSIPHALLKLLEIIPDPDVDFSQISQIIQSDPALTTRIMSVANSGAYYQWNEYKDFHRLVVALGLKQVKTITINSAVQQFFSRFNLDDKGFLTSFWKSSLSAASIAGNLAQLTGYSNKDEAYIAGLLHKMGELVCLSYDFEEYVKRLNELQANNHTGTLAELDQQRTAMEQELTGSSIPEIGAWIIQQFDQKTLLSDAILYQREPAKNLAGTPHLIKIINITHKLAEPFKNRDLVFNEVMDVFDLNHAVLEELLEKSQAEVQKAARSMKININSPADLQSDNENIQVKLAENVRTIALSSSLQEIENFHSEIERIERVILNLNVLFGLSNTIFLKYDAQSDSLNGLHGTNIDDKLLAEFRIPLTAEQTLPVRSLLKRIPLFSSTDTADNETDEHSHSVLDRQLQKLLNSEQILCIPLMESLYNQNTVQEEKFGVLVTGVSTSHLPSLKREQGLLHEFSRSTSEVISRDNEIAQRIESILEQEHSQQSLAIRKLVHEANNPLGVIRNYLQILSHKLEDSSDEKLQGQLEILMEEVERVGNIMLKIKEVPEYTSTDNNHVDINQLISRLISIFEDSLFLKTGVKAELNLDESIPAIASNANSIKQILTNLLKNAVEAMPEGGEIQIITRDRVNYNGNQFIELRIMDNGPGIPEAIMKNLFNPVQSTKSTEHSGLGLSIIKNLVNDLGGTIQGSNRYSGKPLSGTWQENKTGAEFVILLPRKLSQPSGTS